MVVIRRLLVLVIVVFSMMDFAYADRPHVIVFINNNETLDSLSITSAIEWNRDDLTDQKIDDLASHDIFTRKPEGNKFQRNYKVRGMDIRVEMNFPEQGEGRELTNSTRVELAIYKDDKLFFHSDYFGKPEQGSFVSKPLVEFRPYGLYLSSSGGLVVKGVHGYSKSENSWVAEGLQMEFANTDLVVVDDKVMEKLATEDIMRSSPCSLLE